MLFILLVLNSWKKELRKQKSGKEIRKIKYIKSNPKEKYP
jgi:hypothetical protein